MRAPPRVAALFLFLAAAVRGSIAQAAPPSKESGDLIEQEIHYIWPITVWSVAVARGLGSQGRSLEKPEFAWRLADLGEKMFDHYRREILPKELEADPEFAEEFHSSDASKMNSAFLRWQKRAYAEVYRVPLDELSWDGSPIPRYKNISYSLKEFYDAPDFIRLRKRIEKISRAYLNAVGKNEFDTQRFRTFVWAEVYRFADAHRPHVHTGAATAGSFFARYFGNKQGAQKFAFEDPRGINPPFGRTSNHQPVQGNLLMYPSWASHFVTPHPHNTTNVYFSFLCWPPGGARDFDWEDDPTGDFVLQRRAKIKKPQAPTAGPPPQRVEL